MVLPKSTIWRVLCVGIVVWLAGCMPGTTKEESPPTKKEAIKNPEVVLPEQFRDVGEQTPHGYVLTLEGLSFKTNSEQLVPEGLKNLDVMTEILNQNKQFKIKIEGHTDDIGKHDHNLFLSKARANSVFDALLQRDVEPSRMSIEGYGPDRPLVENDSEENRAKNRRVEIVILNR